MNELEMLKIKYSFNSTKEISRAWYDNKKSLDKGQIVLLHKQTRMPSLKLHWDFELTCFQNIHTSLHMTFH